MKRKAEQLMAKSISRTEKIKIKGGLEDFASCTAECKPGDDGKPRSVTCKGKNCTAVKWYGCEAEGSPAVYC